MNLLLYINLGVTIKTSAAKVTEKRAEDPGINRAVVAIYTSRMDGLKTAADQLAVTKILYRVYTYNITRRIRLPAKRTSSACGNVTTV